MPQTGIEPVLDLTRTGFYVLRVCQFRHCGLVVGEGLEPSKAVPTDLQSAPFGHSGIPPYTFILYHFSIKLKHKITFITQFMRAVDRT